MAGVLIKTDSHASQVDDFASPMRSNHAFTSQSGAVPSMFGDRFPRSGAPSAETRPRSVGHTLTQGNGTTAGYEEDEPVLMEVRQVKSQSNHNMLDRLKSPVDANVSFVSHGFTAIGDKVKELNDTLGELQSLGIQHVTNLPELVLVGDQSAGKSSLMSSFSGIYLPRSEGACTRCPVHIRLSGSHGGSWSCRVSLQQDYAYRPPANVTRANPFGPWCEQRREIKEFANLGDPTRIEETLRWAQIATLNPSRDHSLYKPGTGEMWKRWQSNGAYDPEAPGGMAPALPNEAAFSPNTVALDILAPNLADLSFYDLPGVFTNAKQDEDQYLVKVVENLTAKYISHQQAIILWAVPMNADPETSSTFSIIRTQRAQARTIGIMTKADLLPPGPHAAAQWMSMLRGEQHRIGHGYFMTARPVVTQDLIPDDLIHQRDPTRPADDLERQGAYEEAFFNKQLPGPVSQEWRDCFRDFEHRCGVSRLVAFMSQQLGAEFAKCLPQIKEKVTSKLLDVRRELSNLPDVPENPELEVRRSLAEFASSVKTTLEGHALSPLWSEIVPQFQNAILDLKPKYIVKNEITLPSRGGMVAANSHIDLTQPDEMTHSAMTSATVTSAVNSPGASSVVVQETRRRRFDDFQDSQSDFLAAGSSTPSKRQRGGTLVLGVGSCVSGVTDSSSSIPIKAETQAQSDCSSSNGGWATGGPGLANFSAAASKLQTRTKSRTLLEVRAVVASKSKPGMPGIVTNEVYDSLCMEAVRPWDVPLQQFIDRTFFLLDTTLQQLLGNAFSNLRERLVFKKASSILKSFLADQMQAVTMTLMQAYSLESRKLFTLDQRSHAHHQHDEARTLERHRHYYRMLAYLGDKSADRAPPRPWEQMAEEERIRDDARRNHEASKLGPDPYSTELSVCAYVRGYYLTACARFIDTCTLNIISGLIPDVSDALSKWYIDSKLGVLNGMTPQSFQDLMEEDPETSEKRNGLKEEYRRFELTMESIERLENAGQNTETAMVDV